MQALLPSRGARIVRKENTATDKQRAFIVALRNERVDDGMGETPDELSVSEASHAIEWLRRQPKRQSELPTVLQDEFDELQPGIYQSTDGTGTLVKIKLSQQGHLYALILDRMNETDKGEWGYATGLAGNIRRDPSLVSKLTAEQAAQFGQQTGACVFCARELTDDRSITVGYGPTCADKHGLVWG